MHVLRYSVCLFRQNELIHILFIHHWIGHCHCRLSFYIYGAVRLCISFVYLSSLFCILLSSSFIQLSLFFVRCISFVRLRCGKICINGFIIVSLRVEINWHWPQWICQALTCSFDCKYYYYYSNKESVRCLHCFKYRKCVFQPFRLVSFGCEMPEFGYRFKVDSKPT